MAESWNIAINTKVYDYKPVAPSFDIISDPSDTGFPKERLRWTGVKQYHEWSMWFDMDEFNAFQLWYRATLGAGIKSFIFPRPNTLNGFNGETGDLELVFVKSDGKGYNIDYYNKLNDKVKITFKTREV